VREAVIYAVTITSTVEIEAEDTQDAQDKALAYLSEHLELINYSLVEKTVLVDE